MNILYLCDRRACEKCSPECHHTSDVSHAKNFELGADGETWVEKQNPTAFLKLMFDVRSKDLANLRKFIDEQIPTGVVMVPHYVDVIIPEGAEHPVRFCHAGIDLASGSDITGGIYSRNARKETPE